MEEPTFDIVMKDEFNQHIKKELIDELISSSLETLPTEFIEVGDPFSLKMALKCEVVGVIKRK